MTKIRTLLAASALALAGAAAPAAAAPSLNLQLGADTASGSAVEQATYFGHGYGRLCYMPFFHLVQMYGFHTARYIKWRCNYWYNYNYYNNYNYYGAR